MKKYYFSIILILMSFFGIAQSNDNASEEATSIANSINEWFEPAVELLGTVFFFDPFAAVGLDLGATVPFIVVWLVFGAVFFTLRMRFINFRGFKHSIQLIQGKYDDPNDKGEVSHFQALTTALSATVGLGNIASVAVAITIGGPGATFWMIVAGLLGMATKFTECTLGVKYRTIDKDGNV
ncbi:MAG: alanine:cation symporter family protein, partial [Schleiferiaceae bacterium]|nr:alanine:cation symporter family protein [Schleiferiaceae bacterium]